MTTPTDLHPILQGFAEKLAARLPVDVVYMGGPYSGQVQQTSPTVRLVDSIDTRSGTPEPYGYVVTDDVVQHPGTGVVARVARPAAHGGCGFLRGGLLEQHVCAKGHAL